MHCFNLDSILSPSQVKLPSPPPTLCHRSEEPLFFPILLSFTNPPFLDQQCSLFLDSHRSLFSVPFPGFPSYCDVSFIVLKALYIIRENNMNGTFQHGDFTTSPCALLCFQDDPPPTPSHFLTLTFLMATSFLEPPWQALRSF